MSGRLADGDAITNPAYTETATASVVPVNGANALGAQAPVVGAVAACAAGLAALL